MALLFCDGFDHYDTAHGGEKWDGFNANIQSGGREANCLFAGFRQGVTKNVPNSAALIVGAAINPIDYGTELLAFQDAGNTQVQLILTSAGALQIQDGNGNVLGTSASAVVKTGIWQYVEISTVFSATGSATIHVNSASVLSATGINTIPSGNSYANGVGLLGSGDGTSFDDVYICDGTGTVNNHFLGDVKIVLATPNGNGRVNQFSRTGGTSAGNYTAVDDNPPDDDTSYVSSATAGQIDAYTITSIGSVASIKAVQLVASSRKDDAGSRVLALGFGNGTTESYDSGHALGNSYWMLLRPLDQNPLTSAPWAATDLASGQLALEVIS